jgi:hypothetical protein
MANQTIKHAKVRAKVDPDREDGVKGHAGVGVYFGSNVARREMEGLPLAKFTALLPRVKTTHGVCH